MAEFAHLSDSTREIARLDASQRLEHLYVDRWIDYPRAMEAIEQLEILRATPERTRMPRMLIHGDSGIGKSMIVKKFQRAHPPKFDRAKGFQEIELLSVQMPPAPQERRIYGQMLLALNAPYRPSDRLAAVEHTALILLRRLKPRVILVDEVHHLLAGTAREQRTALNLLKFLSNELSCSVVALGTRDAVAAMHSDSQIASRFADFELPCWQEDESFRRFLAAFERLLPLRRPSRLAERDIASLLLHHARGITGAITSILVRAADAAIRSGDEYVSAAILRNVLNSPSQ